jgi:hypothetical protein
LFMLTGNPPIPARREFLAVCVIMIVQYWVLIVLVKKYRSEHGQWPRFTTYTPLWDTTCAERSLSLIAGALGLIPALILGKMVFADAAGVR